MFMWDHIDRKTKQLIRGKIRQIFRWSNEKKQFLQAKQFRADYNGKNIICVFCNLCGTVMPKSSKLYSIDHIEPCGEIAPEFIAKMFDVNNMQILCHDCHDEKTVIDRKNIKDRGLL